MHTKSKSSKEYKIMTILIQLKEMINNPINNDDNKRKKWNNIGHHLIKWRDNFKQSTYHPLTEFMKPTEWMNKNKRNQKSQKTPQKKFFISS